MIGTLGYVFDRSLSFIVYRGSVPKNLARLPPSTAVSTTPYATRLFKQHTNI
jgi:hypothetical protein